MSVGIQYRNPGAVRSAMCRIRSRKMNVTRNVFGPTSFAEAMARRGHKHDSFHCPALDKPWHQQAEILEEETRNTSSALIACILRFERFQSRRGVSCGAFRGET